MPIQTRIQKGPGRVVFASMFHSVQETDPYFERLCRSYKQLSARIDELRRESDPRLSADLEILTRRRQGLLDAILMVFEHHSRANLGSGRYQ